jgi:FtsX-like permease family
MRWYQRFFRRELTEKHLDAELRFHLDQRIADLVATGMAPEAAHRRARLEFGGLDQVKEECRDVGAGRLVETLIQDIRFGLRTMFKDRGFVVAALLALALGIGSCTAIFSVIDNVLLEPFPYIDSHRIFQIRIHDSATSEGEGRNYFSLPEFLDYQEQNHIFDRTMGVWEETVLMGSSGVLEPLDTEFAAIGLVLVCVAIYGVMSYSVMQQRREIGIRIALGANTRDVRSMVLGAGLRCILLGIGVGLLFAFMVARVLVSRIWGVSWYDPLTLLSVVIVLTIVGLAASYLPSLRATRVDPAISLRYE